MDIADNQRKKFCGELGITNGGEIPLQVVLVEEDIRSTSAGAPNILWSHEAILCLIDLYRSYQTEFKDPTTRKKLLWDNIAEEMAKAGHNQFNGAACDKKFRNLKMTYRFTSKSRRRFGRVKRVWQYFDAFDSFFGNDTFVSHSNVARVTRNNEIEIKPVSDSVMSSHLVSACEQNVYDMPATSCSWNIIDIPMSCDSIVIDGPPPLSEQDVKPQIHNIQAAVDSVPPPPKNPIVTATTNQQQQPRKRKRVVGVSAAPKWFTVFMRRQAEAEERRFQAIKAIGEERNRILSDLNNTLKSLINYNNQ